jgi:hypothetical protein
MGGMHKMDLQAVIDVNATPDIFYHAERERYYEWNKERKCWQPHNATDIEYILMERGYPKKQGQLPSAREIRIRIKREKAVDYVFEMAGHEAGCYNQNGMRILVPNGPDKWIEPIPGDFSTISHHLSGLLGPEQLDCFKGWLKLAVEAFRAGKTDPGQALVLAGPPNVGKSFVGWAIISPLLGDRKASPYRSFSGSSDFNDQLKDREHWFMDDQVGSTDWRWRQNFGARLKEATSAEWFEFHPKGGKPISLQTFKRVTISCNSEWQSLVILPLLDDVSLQAKLLIFNCTQVPGLPDVSQRPEYLARITAELPAFLDHLLKWQIPASISEQRYGIVGYINPEIRQKLHEVSPGVELRDLLDLYATEFFESATSWSGRASDLTKKLVDVATFNPALRDQLRDLRINTPQSIGRRLAALCKEEPDRFQSRTLKGSSFFTIQALPDYAPVGSEERNNVVLMASR